MAHLISFCGVIVNMDEVLSVRLDAEYKNLIIYRREGELSRVWLGDADIEVGVEEMKKQWGELNRFIKLNAETYRPSNRPSAIVGGNVF